MTNLLLLVCSFCGIQQAEVPYLKNEFFEYELDYSFKNKVTPETEDFDAAGNPIKYNATPLPYVKMKFKLKVDPDQMVKYKVTDISGGTVRSKKIKNSVTEFVLDMGYSVDIKDRITSHFHSILLYNTEKEAIGKIDIEFSEEGIMKINGIERGKI